MTAVARALAEVRTRIEAACRRAGRDPDGVRLIGVTKTVPVERVREAVSAGLADLGENYVQELARKREAAPGATWHFLGRVQANKAGRLAELADWVQTLEPGRGWHRLGDRVEERGSTVSCLVEVDFTGRRVGVAPEEVEAFALRAAGHPAIAVRGLMTVPPLGEPARRSFARLRELGERLRERVPGLVELSMGMSADYEEAVEEGATMVRVGTAIFGPRP